MESGYKGDQGHPRVQMLQQGSLSMRTGLKPGDVITHVDGTPVTNHIEASTLIQKADKVGTV